MLQLLNYDSESNAYSNERFPYVFGRFTTMLSWIESKSAYGQRYVYRCFNPVDNSWNIAKPSNYVDLAFMFKGDDGIVVSQLLSFAHLSDQNIMDIVTNYVLDDFQRERLIEYCTYLEQPLPIQDLPWQRSILDIPALIDYDKTYQHSRRTVTKAQVANANRKIGEPPVKGLPPEMPKTFAQGTLDLIQRLDQNQYTDFQELITQDGVATHFDKIRDEIAYTNRHRDEQVEAAKQQALKFMHSVPHPMFLESIKPFGLTWDSWVLKEQHDLVQLQDYVAQTCNWRMNYLAQLQNQ